MRRKLQDLTAADFPGADSAKFEQWKQQLLTVNKKIMAGFVVIWVGVIVQLLVKGLAGAIIFFAAFFGWLVYMLAYVRPIRLKADALGKEIGIDRAALKRALSTPPRS